MKLPNNDWKQILEQQAPDTLPTLLDVVDDKYEHEHIVPDKERVFKAYNLTNYSDTKVVILGQDPYPSADDAMGLAFSIPKKDVLPKSLINIFKELSSDTNTPLRTNGDLTDWATQGVLLLNTALTNVAGDRDAHKKLGWNENVIIPTIKALNDKETPVVFILWGNPARAYADMITNPQHHIIESPHPSPLGAYRGFWDSKPFSRTNKYLSQSGQTQIKWNEE